MTTQNNNALSGNNPVRIRVKRAPIENLLSRLEKVRKTGDGKYIACCPAHNDKKPSMGITEMPDGRVLLHCFSHDCGAKAITEAIGLTLSDLFPDTWNLAKGKQCDRGRVPFNSHDVLKALIAELFLSAILINKASKEGSLTQEARKRLAKASGRFFKAAMYVNGGKY